MSIHKESNHIESSRDSNQNEAENNSIIEQLFKEVQENDLENVLNLKKTEIDNYIKNVSIFNNERIKSLQDYLYKLLGSTEKDEILVQMNRDESSQLYIKERVNEMFLVNFRRKIHSKNKKNIFLN